MTTGQEIKIVDTRDNTTFHGFLEKTLPANTEVSDEDLAQYYKLNSDDTQYKTVKRACPYERLIIRRGEQDAGANYYIVPAYPFYKRVPA